MLWIIDLVLGCARRRKARGRRHILSLCARGCAALSLLVNHRFLAALHLWSQPWPLRETLTQWVYQDRSLFTSCTITQYQDDEASGVIFRMHSSLKGTEFTEICTLSSSFTLLLHRTDFIFIILSVKCNKSYLVQCLCCSFPCYESAWWPWLSSYKTGGKKWFINYFPNLLKPLMALSDEETKLCIIHKKSTCIVHVLCKLRVNRW